MTNDEKLHKEIDLIQASINRMSNNSFMCKGWLLSLIVAILALLPENINRNSICIIILLANLCFWWLDAYYLQQEKLYRWKYEWVIEERTKGNLAYLYDLDPNNHKMWKSNRNKEKVALYKLLFNKCIAPMYGGISTVALYMILLKQ